MHTYLPCINYIYEKRKQNIIKNAWTILNYNNCSAKVNREVSELVLQGLTPLCTHLCMWLKAKLFSWWSTCSFALSLLDTRLPSRESLLIPGPSRGWSVWWKCRKIPWNLLVLSKAEQLLYSSCDAFLNSTLLFLWCKVLIIISVTMILGLIAERNLSEKPEQINLKSFGVFWLF